MYVQGQEVDVDAMIDERLENGLFHYMAQQGYLPTQIVETIKEQKRQPRETKLAWLDLIGSKEQSAAQQGYPSGSSIASPSSSQPGIPHISNQTLTNIQVLIQRYPHQDPEFIRTGLLKMLNGQELDSTVMQSMILTLDQWFGQ